MFGTEKKEVKKEAANKVDYVIKVDKVIKTKNDSILILNLDVNGVLINGCMLKEVTVKKDGTKYKAGDKCYVLDYPSVKRDDKYYRQVWFPVTNANMDSIIAQVKELM